jgi:hypothetical protein
MSLEDEVGTCTQTSKLHEKESFCIEWISYADRSPMIKNLEHKDTEEYLAWIASHRILPYNQDRNIANGGVLQDSDNTLQKLIQWENFLIHEYNYTTDIDSRANIIGKIGSLQEVIDFIKART